MTCIVAKVVEGVIHIAGDRLGSNGYTKTLGTKPKVFLNGEFIFGYTTSFRMGQLLEFSWNPPEKLNSQSESAYIYKTVVSSIKELLKNDGFATDKEGGTFLFGYRGKLYKMQNDFAIFEVNGYDACGCGEDKAMAVMYTLGKLEDMHGLTVEQQLALSIEAASEGMCGVSKEYHYLTLGE